MIIAPKVMGEYPRRFQFTAPHGHDDAVAVRINHVERYIRRTYLRGMTRTKTLQHIKTIEKIL